MDTRIKFKLYRIKYRSNIKSHFNDILLKAIHTLQKKNFQLLLQ